MGVDARDRGNRDLTADPWGDGTEPQQGEWIVIGRDPVVTFHPTTTATMQHDLFPLRSEKGADRRHQGATATRPIPRSPVVDVAGRKAERTVVAVPATRHRWADECSTVTAFESLATIGRSPLWRPMAVRRICPVGLRRSLRGALPPERTVVKLTIVVDDVVEFQVVAMETWHGCVLPAVKTSTKTKNTEGQEP